MPARSSRTAELMALQRALESARPRSSRLFRDAFARHFVSRRWRLVIGASRVGALRRGVEVLYDRVAGPGPSLRGGADPPDRRPRQRRARLDRPAGPPGAGFDARAYRLSGLEQVSVFEVDHPATQQAKREVLGRVLAGIVAGDPLAWHVRLVPVDLERDDLARALRGAGYRDGTPSLFVWEGVSNDLTPAAVDQTLGAVHGLAATATGSLLVFTYVDRAVLAGDDSRFPEARRWVEGVRRSGGPWRFGLDPAEVAEFLARRGFGSSAMCPPPRPASGTLGRWAGGSGGRRCITWSRPRSWQRHELARPQGLAGLNGAHGTPGAPNAGLGRLPDAPQASRSRLSRNPLDPTQAARSGEAGALVVMRDSGDLGGPRTAGCCSFAARHSRPDSPATSAPTGTLAAPTPASLGRPSPTCGYCQAADL
jgi:O-methyltransferase involved in polyketide biosynthesis